MAFPASSATQGFWSYGVLLALVQAASWTSVDGAAAPRRALSGLEPLQSSAPRLADSQYQHRGLLSITGGAVPAGGSNGTQSGTYSNSLSGSAGILAGCFLGIALLGTMLGCIMVRVCGRPAHIMLTSARTPADAEGEKADRALDIPVLKGQRISQPDGTFVCAIESGRSADLDAEAGEAHSSCGSGCTGRECSDSIECSCDCKAVSKV